jgi:hypothetical protein
MNLGYVNQYVFGFMHPKNKLPIYHTSKEQRNRRCTTIVQCCKHYEVQKFQPNVNFASFLEVTECDQTESDKSRHYAILESDKTLFGMR